MDTAARTLLLLCLLSVGCLGGTAFFPGGEVLHIDSVTPELANGTVGGEVALHLLADPDAPSEEEWELLEPVTVRIAVDLNLSDAGCDQPTVVFGSRNAHVLSVEGGDIDVLPPPGPLAGGSVDVMVVCPDRTGTRPDGYDYVLGSVTEDGVGRRLEGAFADEYASFALLYQAEPWLNWPDPVGLGSFFDQPVPRASMAYTATGAMTYAGPDALGTFLPERPTSSLQAPEHGDALDGGPELVFFRERDTADFLSPVTSAARKLGWVSDDEAAWLVVPHRDAAGADRLRYLRLGPATGSWCAEDLPGEGCTGDDGEDQYLSDTRVPVDSAWTGAEPDRPDAAYLLTYAQEVPEHLAVLAGEEDPGIQLDSGTYRDVRICRSFDRFGSFPFEPDGYCITLETLPELFIERGARWVDLPDRIVGSWSREREQGRYEGFEGAGASVFSPGVPVWISYEGGFTAGRTVPAKNPARAIPDRLPEPGTPAFDEHPYLVVPEVTDETFLGDDSDFANWGLPADLSRHPTWDWIFPTPGHTLSSRRIRGESTLGEADGWGDSFVVVTLEVLDRNWTGLGPRAVWRAALWAWADDDSVVAPAELLATLPPIAHAGRPPTERLEGEDLLGVVTMTVHRPTAWTLGDDFLDSTGRGLVDVQAISSYYFHNRSSCEDGVDNDGDGTVDGDDAGCARGSVAPFEATACQDGRDNDGDGLLDARDPDCLDEFGRLDLADDDEGNSCSDGEDNDGDGLIDLLDPSCRDGDHSSEGGVDADTPALRIGAPPVSITGQPPSTAGDPTPL